MDAQLSIPSTSSVPVVLGQRAAQFADASLADATRKAYAADWGVFITWAAARGADPLPADPHLVCDYLAHAASLSDGQVPVYAASTLGRWVASINAAHAAAGLAPPGLHPHVKAVMSGIRRTTGKARPRRQAKPLLTEDLVPVIRAMPTTWPRVVTAARDATLLVTGFAGAFRRSELTALTAGDLTFHADDGVKVRLRWSKTDQEGRGATKALPFGARPVTCPVCHLGRWMRVLAARGRVEIMRALLIEPGDDHICSGGLPEVEPGEALFPVMTKHGRPGDRAMSPHAVNQVVKRRVSAAEPGAGGFSAHSLRAGFITQAIRGGATTLEVMRQTHHTDPATVELYAREHHPLLGNAVTKVGL